MMVYICFYGVVILAMGTMDYFRRLDLLSMQDNIDPADQLTLTLFYM